MRVIEERARRVLEKFGQAAISGVRDPTLLAVLNDVRSYWRDMYRPTLTMLSCEAVGGEPELVDKAGVMFTLASSGYGLHDDILDKSTHKHLRMTIMGLHGLDSTLLVGDLLIAKAWTIVHEMIRQSSTPIKIAAIVEAYGNFSIEICEAEFMETLCRRKLDTDLDFYKNVLWKAMAEMEACTRIGAIMGEGKTNEVEALAEFGRRLGFMSRLADDVEDCLNIKGDLLHRIKYESVPFPLLYAAKYSREKYRKIKKVIEKAQLTPLDAKTLLKSCFDTEAFEFVRRIARKNEMMASRNLSLLRPSDARNVLAVMNKKSYERIANLCI